jgi:heterodisulfide reductase subunit B
VSDDVSYYPGCSLDGTARENGESVEAVFKTLGIELQELPTELLRLVIRTCGNDEQSISLAARNLYIAEKIGLDLVVPVQPVISVSRSPKRPLWKAAWSKEFRMITMEIRHKDCRRLHLGICRRESDKQ